MPSHVTVLGEWILTVAATLVVLNFLWGGFAAHHADSPAVQGLKNLLG